MQMDDTFLFTKSQSVCNYPFSCIDLLTVSQPTHRTPCLFLKPLECDSLFQQRPTPILDPLKIDEDWGASSRGGACTMIFWHLRQVLPENKKYHYTITHDLRQIPIALLLRLPTEPTHRFTVTEQRKYP